MQQQPIPSQPSRQARSDAGFSLIEALVASLLMLIIGAGVFAYYMTTSKTHNSQSSGRDMQQAARVAADELSRTLLQAGFGVERRGRTNPAGWQMGVVHAGAHALAINADINSSIGPIDASQTLTFPTGETYNGEGDSATTDGAETYYYSLDANGDNTISTADLVESESGTFNPASGTANPMDFALFRRIYGYDGTEYKTETVPIIGNLFTNGIDSMDYPDGTTPAPLFTYVLTEDLNDNGVLEDAECVVDTGACPPTTDRAPLLYTWGDTDFDGSLSDSERDALRTMPVGAAEWSKNRLASGGSYGSTTLNSALSPADPFAFVLEVADASKLIPGAHIRIGTGSDAESVVVESVSTTDNTVVLTASIQRAHASGQTVQMLPSTMLAGIRAVHVNFTSMSPTKDFVPGTAPTGQTGHATQHGLAYRTFNLERTVELVNQTTTPLYSTSSSGGGGGEEEPNVRCPLTIAAECGGSSLSSIQSYVAATVPLTFRVTDADGTNVGGIDVSFSTSADAGGLSVSGAETDGAGLASVTYTPTGSLGTDTIEALVTCEENDYTDSVAVSVFDIEVDLSENCLSSVSSRTPNPTANWSVQVRDSEGVVTNHPILMALRVDEEQLSPIDAFNLVQADLYVDGSNVGSTDSSGWTAKYGFQRLDSQVLDRHGCHGLRDGIDEPGHGRHRRRGPRLRGGQGTRHRV